MSFGNRKRLMEEVEGTPLNPWVDDLDAFILSWEDLNGGGHGTWYRSSVEESYTDELHDAYKQIDSLLTEGIAIGSTEDSTTDSSDTSPDDSDQRDREASG